MTTPTTVGPVSVADLAAGDLLDLEHDPYANHEEFCGSNMPGHGGCMLAFVPTRVGDDYDVVGQALADGWFRVFTHDYGGWFDVPSDHQLMRVGHID